MIDKVHLYWGYDHIPHLLNMLRTGASLCGKFGTKKDQLTNIPKYCTCRECNTAYQKNRRKVP